MWTASSTRAEEAPGRGLWNRVYVGPFETEAEASMVVESFGKTRPIAPNDTEEGRSQNRRVEFHIGDVPMGPSI